MIRHNRLLYFLALSTLIFSCCLNAPAESPKKLRLQLDWYPDAERGGYVCASVNGYYKEAGLEVELFPASPEVGTLATMLAGRADLCLVTSDQAMMAHAQGLPVLSVMATMQHDPQGVMVHSESPVKDFSDLEGRSIAVAPGTAWFLYVTKKYHLTNVREVPLTFSVATFLSDQNYIQQVFVTSEPYVCAQHHVNVRTLLIKDTGCFPYRVVAATDQLIARDPAAMQAFVTASIKGWQKYLTDPSATDAEIKKLNPEMTQDLLNFSRKTLIAGQFVSGYTEKGETIGKLDPARLEAEYKILRDLNLITGNHDYTESYTTQFCGRN